MAGGTLDVLTPDEFVRLIPRPEQKSQVRATGTIELNAAGSGSIDLYKVPTGYELVVHRFEVYIGGGSPPLPGPVTGAVALNAGAYLALLRSGTLITYGQPVYGGTLQVPGEQSWGEWQGPYLRNGEVFQVAAAGLTANVSLTVMIQGSLRLPQVKG